MNSINNNKGFTIGEIVKFGTVIAVFLAGLITFFGCVGTNNAQDWKIVQYPGGEVRVVDTAGWYNKGFGHVWTYPRNFQVEYDKEHAFPVIFNDSGTGIMNTMVRFSAPTTIAGKLELHNQFGGNLDNIELAVWAHMSNSMKATGPIMSSSEHQSARRSEFDQLVQEQLNAGLFETRKVSKDVKDANDEKSKAITVYYTEIIMDEKGKPKIANVSPLAHLGLAITQFSVTHVQYDDTTQKQFEQKKQAFLAAESSKAKRESEVQERLMIEQRGLKERAENEAVANKQKATATILADQEKQVAETKANQEKQVAETNSAKLVAVALLTKQAAETAAEQEKAVATTKANQQLEVAKLERQAAEENAKKEITLAEAKKQSLALGGAISEREQKLAQIAADRDVNIATQLSKIAVPQFVINGGGADSKDGLTNSLLNIRLLEASGLIGNAVKK